MKQVKFIKLKERDLLFHGSFSDIPRWNESLPPLLSHSTLLTLVKQHKAERALDSLPTCECTFLQETRSSWTPPEALAESLTHSVLSQGLWGWLSKCKVHSWSSVYAVICLLWFTGPPGWQAILSRCVCKSQFPGHFSGSEIVSHKYRET